MGFQHIVGQERAIAQLQRILRHGVAASGYLFVGPEGVGKRLTALAFAKALNCERPVDTDSCDACATCVRIDHGSYPDLLVLAPEGPGDEIRIETMKEMIRVVHLTPLEAQAKVCIIDGAERLNEASANAFLKTLEEPPGATAFLLLTHDRYRLWPTIVSRCQEVRFDPLPLAVVAQQLQARKPSTSAEEVQTLARWAGGALGKALQLAEDELAREKWAWIRRLTDPRTPFDVIEKLSPGRAKAQRAVELVMSWYRDLLVLRCGASEVMIHRDLAVQAQEASVKYPVDELVERIRRLEALHRAIDERANVKLALAQLTLGTVPSHRSSDGRDSPQ